MAAKGRGGESLLGFSGGSGQRSGSLVCVPTPCPFPQGFSEALGSPHFQDFSFEFGTR